MKNIHFKLLVLSLVLVLSSTVCARLNRGQGPGGARQPGRPVETQAANQPQGQEPSGDPAPVETVLPQTGGDDSQPVDIPSGGPMKQVAVAEAEARGAVCNDGSPAAYYLRQGSADSRYWVVHLQGGGFCFSDESCQERKGQEPDLMTTGRSSRQRPGNGIESTSPNRSADFASFNHVFIAYCSSDLWSGDREASSETGGLHFRGAAIVRAVIEDLMNPEIIPDPNLALAEQVIFSGTSAGGAGVLAHLDWLAEQLPQAEVRGIDDAGWFIDVEPYDSSVTPIRQQVQEAYKFWNGTVDADCAAANAGQEGLCYLGPVAFPHLQTPLFVQIAQFDGPQLLAQGLRPPIDQSEVDYATRFAEAMRQSLEPVPAVFSPADRTHGLLTNQNFWTVQIEGVTLRDALMDWIVNQKDQIQIIGTGMPKMGR